MRLLVKYVERKRLTFVTFVIVTLILLALMIFTWYQFKAKNRSAGVFISSSDFNVLEVTKMIYVIEYHEDTLDEVSVYIDFQTNEVINPDTYVTIEVTDNLELGEPKVAFNSDFELYETYKQQNLVSYLFKPKTEDKENYSIQERFFGEIFEFNISNLYLNFSVHSYQPTHPIEIQVWRIRDVQLNYIYPEPDKELPAYLWFETESGGESQIVIRGTSINRLINSEFYLFILGIVIGLLSGVIGLGFNS